MPSFQRVGGVNKVKGTRVWMSFSDLFSEDFLRNLKNWQGKKVKEKERKKESGGSKPIYAKKNT